MFKFELKTEILRKFLLFLNLQHEAKIPCNIIQASYFWETSNLNVKKLIFDLFFGFYQPETNFISRSIQKSITSRKSK